MLSKIDENLREKIRVMKMSHEYVDVIIQANDYEKVKRIVQEYSKNFIFELPIVHSVATKILSSDLYKIAGEKSIKFISSNSKVCGLIYKSKDIMHTKKLEERVNKIDNHTCVVIDTGVYPHIDFCLGKNRIIHFVDLVNDRNIIYDDNGHGTFVTGILCGNSIVDKYSGIDNKCNIIVIKALDDDGETSTINILKAMQWVLDNKDRFNIKVVCMSFGSETSKIQDPMIYGAEVLWKNGIVVVSAGGNSGPERETIMSPGASRKIITVGSLDTSGEKFDVANFSSRGPAFGYFKPDIITPGVDVVSTDVFSLSGNFYTTMSGTSVSTPMVAGVCSMLLNINPNYTPDEIKYMLIKSCVPITFDRNSEGFGWLDLGRIKLL